MAVNFIKNDDDRTKSRISSSVTALNCLDKVSVTYLKDKSIINVDCDFKGMPNFELVWSEVDKYYRVYILVASTNGEKINAGYNIFNIKNNYVAAGFVTMYGLIYHHRAYKSSKE